MIMILMLIPRRSIQNELLYPTTICILSLVFGERVDRCVFVSRLTASSHEQANKVTQNSMRVDVRLGQKAVQSENSDGFTRFVSTCTTSAGATRV